jgi:hypothetical protein
MFKIDIQISYVKIKYTYFVHRMLISYENRICFSFVDSERKHFSNASTH